MLRFVPLFLIAACSGASAPPPAKPTPTGGTKANLAGHRCSPSDGTCQCRQAGSEDQAEQQPPAEGTKRFEVRLESVTGMVWVKVGGEQVYKDVERAEDCFYLDLPAGKHPVSVHAKAQNAQGGVGVGVHFKEHNPKGPWWYESFNLQCGVPGPCTKDTLAAWKKEVDTNRRALRDPCGSARVQSLQWQTGRMPDAEHPEDLTVEFLLNVPAYEPTGAAGDESCPEN